jgi:uncharacterized membrane protein YgcG
MKWKFILYALVVSMLCTTASWSKLLARDDYNSGSGRGGSSWSSNTGDGGGSWGGGGGGHK